MDSTIQSRHPQGGRRETAPVGAPLDVAAHPGAPVSTRPDPSVATSAQPRHARFESRGRRERQASDLLGMDVRSLPKAALAVVAVYLALALDEAAGFDAARDRLFREWEVLHLQNIIEAPVPKRRGGDTV